MNPRRTARKLAGTALKTAAVPVGWWDDILGNRFKVIGWLRSTLHCLGEDLQGRPCDGSTPAPPSGRGTDGGYRAEAGRPPREAPASSEPEAGVPGGAGLEVPADGLPEPVPGYDRMNVRAVTALVKASDQELVERILRYERVHKNRKTVTEACSRALSQRPLPL